MKPKVICIAGVGHSGSTVLAIALGNHPNIENVGELHKIPRSGWTPAENRRCSCGLPIHECHYWMQVHDRWTEEVGKDSLPAYVALQKRFESSRSALPRLLYESMTGTSAFIQYSTLTSALYRSILEVSGKDVIVDSSKNPVRAFALSVTNQIDLRVIHLIRDGRGMAWSYMKPRTENVEAGVPRGRCGRSVWRSASYWMRRNLETEWVLRRIGKQSVARVLYEEFVEHPNRVLNGLGELVSEDLSRLSHSLANRAPLTVGHMGAGNRLRMAKSIVIRRNTTWQQGLSDQDKTKFWLVAGWCASRYGYRRCG